MTNQNFNYQLKTTIHAQENGIANIPMLFARLGAKRVVLFSDQGLKQLGYIEKFSALFEGQHQVELVGTYTDIEPDATCDNINAAISYAHSVQADAILSVGGGSVIDASKGVKYAFHKNINDIRSIIAGGGHMEVWPNNQDINIPHIAVPTTAGTGAEASPIAVFFNEHENIKASLVASGLEADIAVLDPTLTTKLPAHLTRSTAMDALTHAVEAIVSPMSNSFTDAYGIHAAKLIIDNLPLVLEQPDNLVARANLLQASTMAISAFYASLGGIPIHNCAHAFGAISHIPHGDANTVLMPIVVEALPEFYVPNAPKLAAAFSLETSGSNEMAYQRVLGFLREFQVRIGAMQRFSQWSFDDSIKQEIAQAIEKDISFQFYPMTPQAIANIIEGAV
ncbi:iron-containing alcohol dehydrogenase [Vibrio fortis]|jgi:alcohol dehydrogenase class IV|uniref:iron-containing alcohol dehydrogenase n=1 Tax=Vibrio fortis TaxID=212667 RepID=UPI0036F319BA